MGRKTRRRQWPNVYERIHRGGEASYVVDLGLVNQKRERHSFKDKESADTFAGQKLAGRTNEGTAALALSQETRAEAAKAEKLLKPHGVTLEEAAQYYAKHVIAVSRPARVRGPRARLPALLDQRALSLSSKDKA